MTVVCGQATTRARHTRPGARPKMAGTAPRSALCPARPGARGAVTWRRRIQFLDCAPSGRLVAVV